MNAVQHLVNTCPPFAQISPWSTGKHLLFVVVFFNPLQKPIPLPNNLTMHGCAFTWTHHSLIQNVFSEAVDLNLNLHCCVSDMILKQQTKQPYHLPFLYLFLFFPFDKVEDGQLPDILSYSQHWTKRRVGCLPRSVHSQGSWQYLQYTH